MPRPSHVILAVLAGATAAATPAPPPARGQDAPAACAGPPAVVLRVTGTMDAKSGDHPLVPTDRLASGAQVAVARGTALYLGIGSERVRAVGARLEVRCVVGRGLVLALDRGRVRLRTAPSAPVASALVTPEAGARAVRGGATFAAWRVAARRRTVVRSLSGAVAVWSRLVRGRVVQAGLPGQRAVVEGRALPRLDVEPFAPPAGLRRATLGDGLPPWWADGSACATGCRAPGALAAWPLRPFHRQHPLRAGIDELRTATLHVGIDIQARDGAPVYALQAGSAHVIGPGGVDERVQVGDFVYWHVRHRVAEGQAVAPLSTVVGTVLPHFGHLHLSERHGATYLNPLRPGGRALWPWRDTAPPVIGLPRRSGDRVLVRAYDPQSFVARTTYETPVLAPAALAYRLADGVLHFALRATQVLPFGDASAVFAPDARAPGFTCFDRRSVCRPDWDLVLAGGLAPGIGPGPHRITIYAWDFAGNASALEARLP